MIEEAPKRGRSRATEWLAPVFWIGVGLSLLFLLAFVVSKIVDFLSDQAAIASGYLPSMTRDFLLWFADDVLPVIAPLADFANDLGTKWNGALTVVSFIVAVLGIVIALRSK